MTLPTSYALYPGWNAADSDLVLVSTVLAPYVTPYMGAVQIEPRSGLVNTYPIRSQTLDGSERGDGMINLTPEVGAWFFGALPIGALQYWITTYFSGGSVTSVPMTIATRRYEQSTTLVKANVYAQLPVQGVDFVYDSGWALGLQQRFGDFVQL